MMKNKILMVFLPVVAVLVLCGCNNSVDHDYDEAYRLYEEKDYEQAYSMFTDLGDYKASKTFALKCCYNLGKERRDERNYVEAINYWKKCGNYKDSVECIRHTSLILADEYCINHEYDKAISILGDFAGDGEAADKLHKCRYQKAEYLISKKKYDEAETILNEIKIYMPVDDLLQECYFEQGVALYKSKKYDKAVENFLALEKPNHAEKYLIAMAEKYEKKGNNEQVKKICAALPNSIESVEILKRVLFDEKYENFRKLKKLDGTEKAMSKKETEAFLKKNIYGKWYDYDTGEEHVIDEISRDGYLYGIYAASRDYTINFYYIYYYYPNDPDRIYCELWHVSNLVTEGGGIAQPELGGYKKKGFHSEDHYYGRMYEQ